MAGPKGFGLGFPNAGNLGAGFVLIFQQGGNVMFADQGLAVGLTVNGPGDVTIDFSAESIVEAPQGWLAQLFRGAGGGAPTPDAVGLANAAPTTGAYAIRVVWPNPVDGDLISLFRFVHPDVVLDQLP